MGKKKHKKKNAAKQAITPASVITTAVTVPAPVQQEQSKVNRLLRLRSWLPRAYAFLALGILLASTVYWSSLGAVIHQSNADQLANSMLFADSYTLNNAFFPGAHTFLLKWPLFWLTAILHLTPTVYAAATIGVSVVTVACFAYILYRIERRPYVIGTLFLALASVLMLVPAQPYPGGILPVNMAMITTRNIEYIWYMAALFLLVRAVRVRSRWFVAAIVVLGILIASDKLFLSLSAGGALIALAIYCACRKWREVSMVLRWLLATVLAFVFAGLILWIMQALHITHIDNQANVSPYQATHDLKMLVQGSVYAGFGVLTNFGANPALTVALLRDVPRLAWQGFAGIGAVSFIINGIVFIGGIYVALRLLLGNLFTRKAVPESVADRPVQFTAMLLWTSMAAVVVFVVSNHYYPVDGRYLSITLFAVFSALATYLRTRNWPPRAMVVVGCLLFIAVGASIVPANRTHAASIVAMSEVDRQNATIVEILRQHKVSTLVGDYWRVLPVRLASDNAQQVTPLASCVETRSILSSRVWQPDLHNHSFAYLLSMKKSLTGYPACSLDDVVQAYGRPNASALVSGTLSNPQELLLFYDKGMRQSAPATPQVANTAPATVVPISPEELPHIACSTETVMNIVAHEDDDMLFMNPDLMQSIKAGNCVRTIYMTAGDAGDSQGFWLSREKGAESAYASVLGTNEVWVHRIVKLADNQYITVANPKGNKTISLIFMHLPDGNVSGNGFSAQHNESLSRLHRDKISMMHTVDDQSSYTSSEVVNALTKLMQLYEPSEIRTQSTQTDSEAPEHSDHRIVGAYATDAYNAYGQQIPLRYYAGYPTRLLSQNVFGDELADKMRMFNSYANFDHSVCQQARGECDSKDNNYSFYLRRQYHTEE